MFNQARNEEYDEVIDRCQDFFKEIDKEIDRKHFTFGELEENEEDFEKLKNGLKKSRNVTFSRPVNPKPPLKCWKNVRKG
ncbi:MAG: hypothetical protein K6T65_03030 [Peptococcaceae bacterium]|nr:hypothetical protein [Peptococcaceae bacterium]